MNITKLYMANTVMLCKFMPNYFLKAVVQTMRFHKVAMVIIKTIANKINALILSTWNTEAYKLNIY